MTIDEKLKSLGFDEDGYYFYRAPGEGWHVKTKCKYESGYVYVSSSCTIFAGNMYEENSSTSFQVALSKCAGVKSLVKKSIELMKDGVSRDEFVFILNEVLEKLEGEL